MKSTLLTTMAVLAMSHCDEYTIGGYEFEENRGWITIYDQDSTKHTYKFLELDTENFCLEHWQYESVSKDGLDNQKTKD